MRNIKILIAIAFIMVGALDVEKKEVCKMVKVHKKAENATAVPKKQAPKKTDNKK